MAPSKGADGLVVLQASISSTATLIKNFQLALQSPTPPHPKIESPPQPLALLSDSCKILKAQTTKLSLLILNQPFTPSAITYILNACSGGCLPAMMSALELCTPDKYSHLLHNQIKSSISRIMTELLNLIASIPQDERGIEPQSRDTLASTGVLWAECNKMVTLASDGIVFLATQKVQEYHSLLKDAIQELEEWDPEEEEHDSDEDSISSHGQQITKSSTVNGSDVATSLETLSVTDVGELQKRSLSTLRTVRLLYPALQKRRIGTLPNITSATSPEALPSSEIIENLDSMISSTRSFTEAADEIAGALYESDESQVEVRLKELVKEAELCGTRAKKDWNDDEDEFAEWVGKWLMRLKEVGSEGWERS